MTTLNKLLDKAKEMCGSDLATAKRIHVTRSAVSKWRHGGKITPEQLAKVIELAQQDPALAVQVLQEQDATPEERRLWSAVWDRLSPVITVTGAMLLMVTSVAPTPSPVTPPSENLNGSAMYIMRTRVRRWFRKLDRSFTQMTPWFRYGHGPSTVLA